MTTAPAATGRAGTLTLGAIDPGLDRVSLAVFRYAKGPLGKWRFANATDKARQFVAVEHVETSPKLELGERLELIARGVHTLLRRHGVERLYIERPAIAGAYRERSARGLDRAANGKYQIAMMHTHYASGAIIASARTVLGAGVVLIPAQSGRKAQRLEYVRTILVAARVREVVRNQDDLDAIGIGLGAEWPF